MEQHPQEHPQNENVRPEKLEIKGGEIYEGLLSRVSQISGLSMDEAAEASAIVLCTLEDRLGYDEVSKLERELPAGLLDLTRQCKEHSGAAANFGRSGFYQHIAKQLGRAGNQVGPIVAGVLTATRENITAAEASQIAEQLPEDLKALWERPDSESMAPALPGVEHRRGRREPASPELREKRHESRTTNTYLAFLEDLAETASLPAIMAERAALTVLCNLERRITRDEAEDLEAQLPVKLNELLVSCPIHTGGPEKFGLPELYSRVAGDMDVSVEEAVPLVHYVFAAIGRLISPGEIREVAAQLPKDIARTWLYAAVNG